jgi:hypothetical protein
MLVAKRFSFRASPLAWNCDEPWRDVSTQPGDARRLFKGLARLSTPSTALGVRTIRDITANPARIG